MGDAAVDAQALLERITKFASANKGPLVAQQVYDALQAEGEFRSVSLSRVRKACAKLNKEEPAPPPPPPAAAARKAKPAAAPAPPAFPPRTTPVPTGGVELLREAYATFRDREMQWLYSLPPKRQTQLFGPGLTGADFPAQHVMHNGEVALLLAGQKPCVLIGHFNWPGSATEPSFGAALAKEVIKPWLDEFNLGPALGLSLHELKGDQQASDDRSKSTFRGSWLLLSERHALAAEVRKVFLKSGTKHATAQEQGRALGYPGTLRNSKECCRVFYMAIDREPFVHPTRDVSSLCCCVFLEYRALPTDSMAVGAHFKACLAALKEQLNIEMYLDLEDMNCWPAHATALCCATAFGSTDATVEACTKDPGYLKMWTKDKRMGHALVLVDDCVTAMRSVGSRVRVSTTSEEADPALRGAEGVGVGFEGRGDLEMVVQLQLSAPAAAVEAHSASGGRAWVSAHLLELVDGGAAAKGDSAVDKAMSEMLARRAGLGGDAGGKAAAADGAKA